MIAKEDMENVVSKLFWLDQNGKMYDKEYDLITNPEADGFFW